MNDWAGKWGSSSETRNHKKRSEYEIIKYHTDVCLGFGGSC